MLRWLRARTDALLEWQAGLSENLVFRDSYGRMELLAMTDVVQWAESRSESRREFPDQESFIAFCEKLDTVTRLRDISINGGPTLAPRDAIGRLLNEPAREYTRLHLRCPEDECVVVLDSKARGGHDFQAPVYIRALTRVTPASETEDPPHKQIQDLLRQYTQRAPRSQTWNPYKSYPLVDNTPRPEVAQRKWQTKIEMRAIRFGALAGGIFGLAAAALEGIISS